MSEEQLRLRPVDPHELAPGWPRSGLVTVIEPAGIADRTRLPALIRDSAERLRRCLYESGALLFRGFDVDSAAAFEDAALAFGIELGQYPYLTSNYRAPVHGHVVEASSLAPHMPVVPHTEQSFASFRPGTLGFCCLSEAREGGDTPLHDMRAVTAALQPSSLAFLRDAMFCKHVVADDKAMQANFATTDRTSIEELCARLGVAVSFEDGRCEFTTGGPCLTLHPRHQTAYFSAFTSTTPALLHFFSRYAHVAGAGAAVYEQLGSQLRADPTLNPNEFFLMKGGHRVDIPPQLHDETSSLLWEHAVVFRWRRGDILFLDNIAVGHSRLPYVPPRNVVAVVGDYYQARSGVSHEL